MVYHQVGVRGGRFTDRASSIFLTHSARSRHWEVVHDDPHHIPTEPTSHGEDDEGAEDEEQGYEFEHEARVDCEGVEVHRCEQGRYEGAGIDNEERGGEGGGDCWVN